MKEKGQVPPKFVNNSFPILKWEKLEKRFNNWNQEFSF